MSQPTGGVVSRSAASRTLNRRIPAGRLLAAAFAGWVVAGRLLAGVITGRAGGWAITGRFLA